MKLPEKLRAAFRPPPVITRTRMFIVLTVAVLADGLQLLLGPLGWTFADQFIDVAAMLLTMWLLGFHFLLLPTFVLEFIPLVEDLPTWTACVVAVIFLRRRAQRRSAP